MEKVKSYRDLQIWQRSVEIAVSIYRLSEGFPSSELYGLASQMRRASVSVASNIAEGHRRSDAEFGRYLTMALGSLAELETQLEIARRVGYLAENDLVEFSKTADVLGRQINTLRQRVTNSQRPTANS